MSADGSAYSACYSSYLIDFVPFGGWTIAAAFALGRKALSPA